MSRLEHCEALGKVRGFLVNFFALSRRKKRCADIAEDSRQVNAEVERSSHPPLLSSVEESRQAFVVARESSSNGWCRPSTLRRDPSQPYFLGIEKLGDVR
jgi:hypothetical protein